MYIIHLYRIRPCIYIVYIYMHIVLSSILYAICEILLSYANNHHFWALIGCEVATYFVSDKLQAGHVVRSTSSRCEPAVEDSVWVMVVEIYNKVDT